MSDYVVKSKQVLLKGTFILSFAALITKILSAVYRVPFQNIVGDIGFYIYQQVYPFYGVATALALSGFPVVISKLYAEKNSRDGKESADRILLPSFLMILVLCVFICVLLFSFSKQLAEIMGDVHLTPLIRTSSLSFLIVPFLSIFRGYFQGIGNMTPTAISQVVEQTVRVTLILLLSYLLISKGYSLYRVGESAIFSSLIGSVFSILLLIFVVLFTNKGIFTKWRFQFHEAIPIFKKVLYQGLAISISGLTLILFQMSDAFQIYSSLVEQGTPVDLAKSLKGIYDRGQPLMQMGLVIATSLSLSIVPIISSLKSSRKQEEIKEYTRFAIQISLTIGAAAAFGLAIIMEPLNTMLFENNLGSNVLRVLSVAVLFASINATLISVLQGLDESGYPAFIVMIGLFLKVCLNKWLIFKLGIIGAAFATNLALVIMLIFLIRKLRKIVKARFVHLKFLRQLFFALLSMAIVIFVFFYVCSLLEGYFTNIRIFSLVQSIGGAIIGAFVFIIMVVRGGIFTKDELTLLPFGHKLHYFLKEEDEV